MRELLICPFYTSARLKQLGILQFFGVIDLRWNDTFEPFVKVHFSQFVKCISLRRLLFGVIWLKVSYNRGPRHPPTTVHPNCFTPLYPLSSSQPPKPSPLQPPSYPRKPFNINFALKNWKAAVPKLFVWHWNKAGHGGAAVFSKAIILNCSEEDGLGQWDYRELHFHGKEKEPGNRLWGQF